MSSHLKAELAATCSTLGRLHKGEYLIEPECIESVKDLIRYLKRDNEAHEIRRYLGKSKVLQNDLIHIIKCCPKENSDLFDVTLRLLINLMTPPMLFYGEEIPAEKIGRNIYLSLIGYSQDYKTAFCDVELWNKLCGKLTDLFETDWTERSADDGIQIERILMLLRNVLQVPADVEREKRLDNDITVHDKVLWALSQSQILELLLYVSSNENEEQYYLNLLEIFFLILREQNPKVLAQCTIDLSAEEKSKEIEELVKVRESEKKCRNKYVNMRNFNATFVMKGVKSLSNKDVVCHRSLEKVKEMNFNYLSKKQLKTRRNKIPVESERVERRSTFSVRLFLKEFCLEFLNCAFKHLMHVVKNKLDSGKCLANDETYYFWAVKFFLDFATASNLDVCLIKDFLSPESFHFVQTSMDNAFERLAAEKKKTAEWVKRIHLILKTYRSLLEALLWMDCSKNPLIRSISREIKSKLFYVVEYREMTLHILMLFDPNKFSLSYLRDLIEVTHLFIKLLEEYSRQKKLVVQTVAKKKSRKKNKQFEEVVETQKEKWESIKDDVYDILCSESAFPEIPPFDAALEIPIDDQKGRAMKKIQKLLHEKKIRDAIGVLRSARQVWPENDCFGSEGMTVEDETMALQEICCFDLGEVGGESEKDNQPEVENENQSESEDENQTEIVEQDFDIMDYKKRLVNRKVIEGCGMLLKNYKTNSEHTNHCVIKILHRIGWECSMPAMLFQASLFWTLLKIMREKSGNYDEINTFTVNLLRKFRKQAERNPVVFLELLFWKDRNVAIEIQHGYEPYEKAKKEKRGKKKKSKQPNDDEDEKNESEFIEMGKKAKTIRKKKEKEEIMESFTKLSGDEDVTPIPALKTTGNTSRVLFEDFESDDEIIALKDINEEKEGPLSITAENSISSLRVIEKIQNTSDEDRLDLVNSQSKREHSFMGASEDESGGEKMQPSVKRQKKGSQTSKASLKKRKRRDKRQSELSSEESEGSDNSRSKRVRCISSDSDVDEGAISVESGRRKRFFVIDSDSDLDANSLNEK